MKYMKIFCLLLSIWLMATVGLTGCDQTGEQSPSDTTAAVTETTEPTTTPESSNPDDTTTADLYATAMQDAVFADESEIRELVTITKESDMVTWNEDGTKVLMLSWHRYPDSYQAGQSFTCAYGEVWVFTDREILAWYEDNADGVTDWTLRLEQLIGLPENKGYTHVSAFWVDTNEMIGPAYVTDITAQITPSSLDASALGDYKDWFDGNIIWSYFDSAYPWTRLGYTYDWGNGGDEYGLSEFIILPDSEIEVAWTVSMDTFLTMLSEGDLQP